MSSLALVHELGLYCEHLGLVCGDLWEDLKAMAQCLVFLYTSQLFYRCFNVFTVLRMEPRASLTQARRPSVTELTSSPVD